MKTFNKKILSCLDWIKSKSLIIYTEYLSSFFIIFGILLFIFLITYYLYLFRVSSHKDQLSNMTTIFSFIVGFWAIKYQINHDFMKKEEKNILEITSQLNLIQKNGNEINHKINYYRDFYFNKKPEDKQLRYLRKIDTLISEQLSSCDDITELVQSNLDIISFKVRHSKISILQNYLMKTKHNITHYQSNLLKTTSSVFAIEAIFLHLNENDSNYINKSNDNLNLDTKYEKNLENNNKILNSSLKTKNDATLLHDFLQKYDK